MAEHIKLQDEQLKTLIAAILYSGQRSKDINTALKVARMIMNGAGIK